MPSTFSLNLNTLLIYSSRAALDLHQILLFPWFAKYKLVPSLSIMYGLSAICVALALLSPDLHASAVAWLPSRIQRTPNQIVRRDDPPSAAASLTEFGLCGADVNQ
jgi:hypothetical protein